MDDHIEFKVYLLRSGDKIAIRKSDELSSFDIPGVDLSDAKFYGEFDYSKQKPRIGFSFTDVKSAIDSRGYFIMSKKED